MFDLEPEFVEWVAGYVHADDVALACQEIHLVPRLAHRNGRFWHFHLFHPPEQRRLRRRLGLLVAGTVPRSELDERAPLLVLGKELRAVQPLESVEGSAQRQRFEDALVDVLRVYAPCKVEQALVRPRSVVAAVDDGLDRPLAYAAHRPEPKPDGALRVHAEFEKRFVHVRAEDRDAPVAAFLHEQRDLLDVVHVVGQHRRHVFGRVIGLQVSGLVGHPRVTRRVRFVEGIRGKRLPVLPDFLQLLGVVAALGALLQELRLHFGNEVRLLFAHRLPQRIRLALREAGQLLRQQHHLLLVHRDSVRLLEVFFARVEVIRDGLLPVLPLDKRRDVFERPRTVQGVHRNEIAKHRGLQILEVLLHPRGFVLEDADGLAALEELVGLSVVEREAVRVEIDTVAVLDIAHRVLDDGQGFQAQEVHLEEAGVFGNGVVKLRARHVTVLGDCHRHVVGDVSRCNDDAAGVDARVAQAAFKDAGGLQRLAFEGRLFREFLDVVDLLETFVAAELFLEGLIVKRKELLETDIRHQLRNAIGVGQRQLEHARGIADGAFGSHGPVRDDLGYLVRAILVDHVVDDLAPSLIVKIDVDIGQAHTVRIQESLEQQIVLNRIHVGDAHTIRYGRPCGRSPARSHAHAHLAGGGGEVLHNEEVAGVAGAFDGLEFEIDALTDFVGDLGVAPFGAFVGQVPQVGVFPTFASVGRVLRVHEFVRNLEGRQQHVALQLVAFARVCNGLGGLKRLGQIRKEFPHLRR